jgi:hypothetical protein
MRRSQETTLRSNKKAHGDEHGTRVPPATTDALQPAGALSPHVAHEDASWSDFRPTFPPFAPQPPVPCSFLPSASQPPVSGADYPQANQDIQRGLSIDFYAVSDPLLVASWASFFRDQYLRVVAQEQGDQPSDVPRTQDHCGQQQRQEEVDWRRDVDSFLTDVLASKVLRGPQMRYVFRQIPFSESKVGSHSIVSLHVTGHVCFMAYSGYSYCKPKIQTVSNQEPAYCCVFLSPTHRTFSLLHVKLSFTGAPC